jgi:hypothetical protein
VDLRAALSPGEQKSYGHNSDTRAEGVLFFQSGVEAAAQRTQKKEKTDQAQSDSLIAIASRPVLHRTNPVIASRRLAVTIAELKDHEPMLRKLVN